MSSTTGRRRKTAEKAEKATRRNEAGLTPAQEQFCHLVAYPQDGSWLSFREAHRRAYGQNYSDATRDKRVFDLKQIPAVTARISALEQQYREDIRRAMGLSAERVLQELCRLAFFDIRKLYDPKTGLLKPVWELDDETAAAITGLEIDRHVKYEADGATVAKTAEETRKFKLASKEGPLQALLKHLGAAGAEEINLHAQVHVYVPDNGRDQAPLGTSDSLSRDAG